MFGKKLILIAATAALALGSISAKDASTVHVRIHSNDKSVCTGAGQSPMSVEGVEGVFCVTGQACVANISNGACPAAQTGLPNGSHCGVVKTGVYGCKPGPAPSSSAPKCDGPGQSPMSVEGAGTYCVTGQACVANISNGACPGPQAGIPHGSYCAQVRPGVWGCRAKTSRHHKHHKSHSKSVCTGAGQSPMSVEGVPGVFCVTGQACVANIADGACPGPQEGLPNGAHCGVVKTGVYGCKPNAASAKSEAPKTEAPKTEAPKTEAPKTVAPTTEAPKTHRPKVAVVPLDHSAKRNSSVSIIIDVDVDNDNDSNDDSSDDKKKRSVDDDSSDDSSDDRRQ